MQTRKMAMIAVAITLVGGPAAAQDAMFSTFGADTANNILNTQIRNSMLGVGSTQARRSLRQSRAQPLGLPAPRVADTGYRADPAVGARVRRQFLAFVARSAGDHGAADMAATFARVDPVATWARQAAPDGMRLGDVADAMAEYWVSNWVMANRRPDPPGRRVRAVRDQLRRGLAADPGYSRLDDAGRQEMAEVFIYNTILQGSVYQRALKTSDAVLLQRASDAAQVRFRNEVHIDLRALALTDQGLAHRG